MSKHDTYEAKAQQLILPIIQAHQFELVDVEYVREAGTWYLRAYVDKPGGITIDDCELVSRAFSELLDKEDFIEESYILEVSSPGLSRPIKKDKDFQRNLEKVIEVKTFKMIDGTKDFEGVLKSFDKENFVIETPSGIRSLRRADAALIRPYIDFN